MYPHVVEDNLMLRVLVGEGMYPHVVEDNLTLRVVVVVAVNTVMGWYYKGHTIKSMYAAIR